MRVPRARRVRVRPSWRDRKVRARLPRVTTLANATDSDIGRIFADPSAYADPVAWHATAARLRREQPIARCRLPEYPEFWAITKHADVMEIERNSDDLHQRAGAGAGTREATSSATANDARQEPRPDGRRRAQGAPRTRQRLVQARQRQAHVRPGRRACPAVRRPDGGDGGQCDFANDIAMHFPLAGDPLDPRAARGRLRQDAQAHPGALRRRGPRHRTRRRGPVRSSR